MTATMSRAERSLAEWLDELPAISAALDVAGEGRRVVLDDLAADEVLLSKAESGSAHPVLLAQAHLAQGVVHFQLAQDGGGDAALNSAIGHCEAAFDLGRSLKASGPRLVLISHAGGVVASALDLMRHTQRRAASRLLEDVSEAMGEALVEQATEAHRGTVTLAAAQALADAAAVVTGKARAAVLQRALDMANDAHGDLARAGELARARIASDTVVAVEKALAGGGA